LCFLESPPHISAQVRGFVRRSCDRRLGLFVTSQVCLRGLPIRRKYCAMKANRDHLRSFRLDLKENGIMRRPAFRHSNIQKYPIRETRMGHMNQLRVTAF